MVDLELLFLMEKADASGKSIVKTSVAAPSVKPFPDRGMADLPFPCFRIHQDWNVLPLAARMQLIQDVVEDAVERRFGLPAAFG